MKCQYRKVCKGYDKDSDICNKRQTNTNGTYYCGIARRLSREEDIKDTDIICNCGHLKNNHHPIEGKGTWCYDCECIEFKEKQKW